MSGVLIKIKSHYDQLPDAYRRLADCVLKHPEEVPFLSVHKLAELASVSVASATRFAHELGYANFKEFKRQLGRDTVHSFEAIDEAIAPTDREDDIIDKAFSGNIRSLEETLKILDRANLKRAADVIVRCRRLVFVGVGSSGHIAGDAALRFAQLDLPAEAHSDPYHVLNQSSRAGPKDVVFGISHSGRSAITVQALQLAMQNGAMTMGISNYPKSPLNQASRIFFCTSFPEARVKVAALSSRVAQIGLLDTLYLLVARKLRGPLDKVNRLNSHAEKLLRLPVKCTKTHTRR